MKKSRKGYVIIALIVLLLAIAIGYAAFSETLTISGTASGSGTWDVKFTDAQLLNNESTEADEKYGSAEVGSDGKTVTATVNLGYPGDGVILDATITNNGSVPAKITEVPVLTGVEDNDPDIEIVEANPADDEVLPVGGSCNVQYRIKWKTDSTATSIDTKSFTITFNYEQETDEFTTEPVHQDS